MADGPWEDYKKTPAPIKQGGPWEDYQSAPATAGGLDASGLKGVAGSAVGRIKGGLKEFGERLTAPTDPGAENYGPVARGLSAMGGAVMGMPGAVYHAFRDPETEEEK